MKKIIYVYLIDEGTDVWRQVEAIHIRDDEYRIISKNPDPEDEKWQFSTGDLVRCKLRKLSSVKEYNDELVAVELITKNYK